MKRVLLCIIFLACVAVASSDLAAAEKKMVLGQRGVMIWEPEHIEKKAPIIIFSHAFGGCAMQSRFLTEMLTAQGYWVVAPNHKDNRCLNNGKVPPVKFPEPSFNKPEDWNDKTYRDRAEDIQAVLAALKQQPEMKEKIDFDRLGLAGHSLGGYTVLGLGGAWPSWKMVGIKAILTLSPFSQPYNIHHTLGGLSAPVMYQGGIADVGTTPFLRIPGGSYATSPAPKYFVEFRGAGHFAWGDMRKTFHPSINAYALAFFDHYVKGKPADEVLTSYRKDVSALWYDSDLGKSSRIHKYVQ